MRTALAALSCLALLPSAAHTDGKLYGFTSVGKFVRIDPVTLDLSFLIDLPQFFWGGGLTYHAPDGLLYATRPTVESIYWIDPITSAHGDLGTISGLTEDMYEGGFAAAPDGTLYFTNHGTNSANQLMRLDIGTLEATPVGYLCNGECTIEVDGLAWRQDGVLIGLDVSLPQEQLVQINPETAQWSPLTPHQGTNTTSGALASAGTVGYFTTGPSPTQSSRLWVADLCGGPSQYLGTLTNVNGVHQNMHGMTWVGPGVDPVGTAFCFGVTCPCGNSNASAGCTNSTGKGGTLLTGGSASVSKDDLSFAASWMPPGQPSLLFVGDNPANGGAGFPFGAGLRCAQDHVVRLGVRAGLNTGFANWTPGLAALGGWSAGESRSFQVWYRDPQAGPCGSGFNLTHAVEVVFEP